jgi:hypothetical protein
VTSGVDGKSGACRGSFSRVPLSGFTFYPTYPSCTLHEVSDDGKKKNQLEVFGGVDRNVWSWNDIRQL